MAEAILLPQFPPDLSGYSLTSHTHSNYALTSHGHSGYASSSHSHSGYATQTWVTQNFAPIGSGGTGGGNTGTTIPSGNGSISMPSGSSLGSISFTRYENSTYNNVFTIVKAYPYNVPSVISSLRVSWTTAQITSSITAKQYGSDVNGGMHPDIFGTYFYMFKSDVSNTSNYQSYSVPNYITQLAQAGQDNQSQPTNWTISASSTTLQSALIGPYAGSTVYFGIVFWCSGPYTKTVTGQRAASATLSNTFQITITPT